MDDTNPLMKFRMILGFDPEDITEFQARKIWAKMEIIDARMIQDAYRGGLVNTTDYLLLAFHEVAEILVSAQTSDDVISTFIPDFVEAFSKHKNWGRFAISPNPRPVLNSKIGEWSAKRDLLTLEPIFEETVINDDPQPFQSPLAAEPVSLGERIERLRVEADITQEKLAELIHIDVRNVQRHLAGTTKPTGRTLFRYERELSKLLNREIVIPRTP